MTPVTDDLAAASPVVHLIDDDAAVRQALSLLLGTMGLSVVTWEDPQAFARGFDREAIGAILLDVRLPGISGLAVLDDLVADGVDQPVIMLTGHGTVELCRRAFKSGAAEFLEKPVNDDLLLDAVQAAILKVKLEHLPKWAKARQERAAAYDAALGSIDGIRVPKRTVEGDHVYNQYTIRVQRGSRDELQNHLKEQQIGTEVYYPYPLHILPAFAGLGYKEGDFPVSERAAKEALSLPISPELTPDQQQFVIETIRDWAKRH